MSQSLATAFGRAIDRGTLLYTKVGYDHDNRSETLTAVWALGEDDPVRKWFLDQCARHGVAPVVQHREFSRRDSTNVGNFRYRYRERLVDRLHFNVELWTDDGFSAHLVWDEVRPHEHTADHATIDRCNAGDGRVHWVCGHGCRRLKITEAKALDLPTYVSWDGTS